MDVFGKSAEDWDPALPKDGVKIFGIVRWTIQVETRE